MNLAVDIALTHIRGRARQTLLSVLGTATGVGFAIAMAALMQGSQRDFIQRIVDVTPHVVVRDEFRSPPRQPAEIRYPRAAVALEGQKPKTELRGIRNPRAHLDAVATFPDLAVAPALRGPVVVRYGGKDVSISLVGIEPDKERHVSQLESDLIAGSLDDLQTTANAIIIGETLATKLGARRGSILTVTSSAGIQLRSKVVALYRSGVSAVDEGTAYALLKKVQVLLDRPNVINELRIRVDDATQARTTARRLESRLGYKAESWDEANEGIMEAFVIRNTIMYTVVSSILLVAAFGIFNVISTIIHEKIHDIAILKSIGFRQPDILRIFVLEGAIIGSAGTIFGWAFGYALFRILGSITIQFPGRPEPTPLPVIFEPIHYGIAAVCALTAAIFASWLPARRAARLNPVDIIRGAA